MFGKPDKKKTVEVNGQQIELQPKPSMFSKVLGAGKTAPPPKPAAPTVPSAQQNPSANAAQAPQPQPQAPAPKPIAQQQPAPAPPPKPQPQATAPPPALAQSQQPQPNKPYAFQFPTLGQKVGPTPQPPQSRPTQPASPSAQATDKPYQRQPIQSRASASSQPNANIFKHIIQGQVAKHPDLDTAMRKEGMKGNAYSFVKRMLTISILVSAAISVVLGVVIFEVLANPGAAVLLGLVIGIAAFMAVFRTFLNFPTSKGHASSKKIERDILFAAKDLIIALRSGMPLFNAITSVSSGYGEASKEFLKIVEKVQLGTSLEDATDEVVSTSKSPSFRKIMLQAAVSIKVGADVISALQSVIDELAQERVIELRRYGQRLNAIAMFYMLFGIILPSMGIAVLTILTTFIPIFTVNSTLLEMVVIGVTFLQVVFLELIRSSRPVFSM